MGIIFTASRQHREAYGLGMVWGGRKVDEGIRVRDDVGGRYMVSTVMQSQSSKAKGSGWF